MSRRKVVLLDRDGVLNRDLPGSVRHVETLTLLPGASEAVALLSRRGFRVLLITNQACVGRGDLTPVGLVAIHDALQRALRRQGGEISGFYVCPHTDEDGCDCRKPKPGLILRAQCEHHFDFDHTYFVGDALRDLEAARAAGCRAALVRTGKGANIIPPEGVPVFADLYDFARTVTAEEKL